MSKKSTATGVSLKRPSRTTQLAAQLDDKSAAIILYSRGSEGLGLCPGREVTVDSRADESQAHQPAMEPVGCLLPRPTGSPQFPARPL